MLLVFSELFHYYGLLEQLNQKKENDVRRDQEKLEVDFGFEDQNEISERKNSDCEEVVLYNIVRETFRKLVNLCVLQRYGVSNANIITS